MEIVGDGQRVEIARLLCDSLPFELPARRKAQKSSIVEILVKCWAVVSGIVEHSTLGRDTTHKLDRYLSLMGRLTSTAKRAITEADEVDKNSKSIKLTGQDLHRMMLAD
jgi:hypothetical protein